MRIALLVEGKTERLLAKALRSFLEPRLEHGMPRIETVRFDGRIPKGDKLRRVVQYLLADNRNPADFVIAITDVYTGSKDFVDASDAKKKMKQWVGEESRFFAHTALHDFEAWLVPYWGRIQELAKSNRAKPGTAPEAINHMRPPAKLLAEVFETGKGPRSYSKVRDAARILEGQDLLIAARECPELRELLNRILGLCGGALI
jgi:hypothetical protein